MERAVDEREDGRCFSECVGVPSVFSSWPAKTYLRLLPVNEGDIRKEGQSTSSHLEANLSLMRWVRAKGRLRD
jgi:hypothetical protein